MEQKLKKLNDHFIIAGFGRVGRHVAHEFARRKAQFVVIEMGTDAINKCILDGYPFLEGIATASCGRFYEYDFPWRGRADCGRIGGAG